MPIVGGEQPNALLRGGNKPEHLTGRAGAGPPTVPLRPYRCDTGRWGAGRRRALYLKKTDQHKCVADSALLA